MISLLLALATLPPFEAMNKGNLRVVTPEGVEIIVPENSRFEFNSFSYFPSARVLVLDNARIFGDGFEHEP